jgi:hypothetical protein
LAKLNGELASAYRGISEAFWGLDANHERAAFGLARQCFDHLFEILAPDDDEIRKSPFFKKKQGTKPHVVSRVERVRYAAATRIRDKQQSEFLAAQASEFVDVYGQLQRLHARAPIGHERAREVLQTFLATVEQWIDALEL